MLEAMRIDEEIYEDNARDNDGRRRLGRTQGCRVTIQLILAATVAIVLAATATKIATGSGHGDDNDDVYHEDFVKMYTETKCKEVVLGDPPVCFVDGILVTSALSTGDDGGIVKEYSQVSQRACDDDGGGGGDVPHILESGATEDGDDNLDTSQPTIVADVKTAAFVYDAYSVIKDEDAASTILLLKWLHT